MKATLCLAGDKLWVKNFWSRRRVSWVKWVCQRRWRGGGRGKLDETVPSSGLAKIVWIKPRGGYKRACETLWGLIQPIGCRQREHVVVEENGKARRGYHTNENSKQFVLAWQPLCLAGDKLWVKNFAYTDEAPRLQTRGPNKYKMKYN